MSNKAVNADTKQNQKDKRKRSEQSSCSDADTSMNKTESGEHKKETKRDKKKSKTKEYSEILEPSYSNMSDLNQQLQEINKKLSNVITKDDSSIKNMIRETFKLMKDEFLESISHRIDILEGKLFEKEAENDQLKNKLKKLEEENQKIKDAQEETIKKEKVEHEKLKGELNNLEQYGRRNNLRIDGIFEDNMESAEQTGQKVAQCLNDTIPQLFIRRCDIDIAHRLGKKSDKTSRPRQIIVKFTSRMTRDTVWLNRRLLTRKKVYVNEDLTKLNSYVLTCMRKKLPDEVESTWSTNGRLFFRNKSGSSHEVKYKDYNHWTGLNWPQKSNYENATMS